MIGRGAPESRRSIPLGQVVRIAIGVLLVVTILWGYPLYGWLTASSRTGPGVGESNDRVDLVISMERDPEPYHLARLRDHGTVAGRLDGDDRRVRLLRVRPGDVDRLTRIAWIAHIDLLEQ